MYLKTNSKLHHGLARHHVPIGSVFKIVGKADVKKDGYKIVFVNAPLNRGYSNINASDKVLREQCLLSNKEEAMIDAI